MLGKRLINSNSAAAGGSCTTDTLQILGDTSCVAYYKMSTATDESGNYDGTPTSVNFNVAGKFGNAGSFNGSSSRIAIPNIVNQAADHSVSLWIKPTNFSANRGALSMFNGSHLLVYVTTDGGINSNGGASSDGTTAGTITANSWNHVVLTYNYASTTYTMYVNGVNKGTSTNFNFSGRTNSIGCHNAGSSFVDYFLGSIDQVRIFNKALSSTEVTTLYDEVYCVPTIVPTANFNPVIYTGTGNSRSLTGVGFKPDFIWMKRRNTAQEHALVDAVRGVQKELNSDTTAAEGTSTNGVTSFDSDGFTVGSNGLMNNTNDTYVAWNWKAGGAAVSNTDGSITSQVSANVDAGFSIATFTGSGAINVGHGLNKAPELIIRKQLNGTGLWAVYSSAIGTGKYLRLNESQSVNTNAAVYSAVTDTTYTSDWSSTTYNWVSYHFHSVDGMSRVGSYVGTGAAGNSINLGFRPAFVMIKITTASNSWFIYDNKRDTTNPNSAVLLAEDSYLEQTDTFRGINFNSNGFEAGNSVNYNYSGTNQSSQTYIFLAFAEEVFTPITRNATNPFGDASELALYKFEDDATDAEGNYNGTASNVTYATGYIDRAAVFNGSNSNVNNTVYNQYTGSVSIWFNSSSGGGFLFGSQNGSGSNKGIALITTSTQLRVYVAKGSQPPAFDVTTTGSNNFFDGQWHHLVLTWDLSYNSSNNTFLYVDNIIKIQGIATTGGWVSGQNSTVPLVFGAYNSSGGGAFAGSLDQARIFNRALDSGEVTQLYNE